MLRPSLVTALSVCLLCTSLPLSGATPRLLHFQGRLTGPDGQPTTGSHSVRFALYTSETTGTLVWSETQEVTPDNGGVYAVLLGGVTPLTATFDTSYWLGLKVDGDPEMTPRFRMTSAAYAFNADRLDGLDSSQVVTKVEAGLNVDISPSSGTGRVTVSVPNAKGGDITSVVAGMGLTGGTTTGDATIDVGVGTGLTTTTDSVSFDTAWGDARYVSTSTSVPKNLGIITNNHAYAWHASGTWHSVELLSVPFKIIESDGNLCALAASQAAAWNKTTKSWSVQGVSGDSVDVAGANGNFCVMTTNAGYAWSPEGDWDRQPTAGVAVRVVGAD